MGIPRVLAVETARVLPSISRYTTLPKTALLQSGCVCHLRMPAVSNVKFTGLYRFFSAEDKNKPSLTKVNMKNVTSSTFEQVKENTKTASYLGVIILGVGVTGVMFYAIFRELFSSKSPNSVYSAALKKCCSEPRIQNALGDPIKGFGEETRRGRRRHVSHLFYNKDGINHLRMEFYIKGSRRRGTVHLEMKEDDRGRFVYEYLVVQMDDYPRDTITLEDNRYDSPSNNEKMLDV